MRCTIRRGLLGTLFAGGLLALGTTAASAEPVTSGSDGLLSGTQITAPITIPVNLGTNSLAVLGEATTETTGNTGTDAATGTPAESTGPVTSGSDGLLSGTQITAPITLPVNLGTNSLAVLGEATTETTRNTETTGNTGTDAATGTPAESTGPVTSGSDGLLSGTQITAPITLPVNLGTNSLAVLGEATTETTRNTETTGNTGTDAATGTPAESTGPVTSGSDGLLSGTQITAPITLPVNLGTNSLAVLGEATTETTRNTETTGNTGTDAATGTPAESTGPVTSGSDGLLSGTQITAPITIPVNLGTNSLAVLGEATTETTRDTGTSTPGSVPPVGPRPGVTLPVVIPAGTTPPAGTQPNVGPEPTSVSFVAEETTRFTSVPATETPLRTSAATAEVSSSNLADTGAAGMVLLWLALPLLGAGLVLIRRAGRQSS
ncbi:chaplin family protein [Arthrobacter sp. Helios]|uniref:chaplin family protein n=1 Tax=Arthrobacter sp. Helios TaxID=2828862 RepID=UPI0020616DEF|nr:chaplin family protein [Arthrobacter sp. Helios]UPO77081.1 DUF320 domain-containing protein [Arthrobacter sp. Helios]